MVEIFITEIQKPLQTKKVLDTLESCFQELKINFDLDNSGQPFPCRHTILRVEGTAIMNQEISEIVNGLGFKCTLLMDKVCL